MYICVYVHIDIWLDKHNMVKQTTCTNKINNHTSSYRFIRNIHSSKTPCHSRQCTFDQVVGNMFGAG